MVVFLSSLYMAPLKKQDRYSILVAGMSPAIFWDYVSSPLWKAEERVQEIIEYKFKDTHNLA